MPQRPGRLGLDAQEPKVENDDADERMTTVVREAMTDLVHEVQDAAREMSAIVNRTKPGDVEEGGA